MSRPRIRARRMAMVAIAIAALAAPSPWGQLVFVTLVTLAAARAGLAVARAWRTHRPGPWRRARGSARLGDPVLLGRDPRGRAVALDDRQLGAHTLIVGATGAGKSTTLEAILAQRITRGDPVVALDMKGSPAFARALEDAAGASGRELRVWTPEGPAHWNPLAHGGPTALKDKLISAERFSEPHYRRAAERYLQTALQVLRAAHPQRAPALGEVVAAMEPGRLRALARDTPLCERVEEYLATLTPDQRSAARGVGTRLALLHESDAGQWLAPGVPAIDLGAALEGGDVVLVSVNSSVYGALGAQLGALAVQDLTSAAGRRLDRHGAPRPATVALDEFSALGADNVLSLLARGREAGVGVLLATQELSDLERAGRGFRDQVLGITAVTLAHRQEVHESAVAISRMAGSRMVWRETRPLGGGLADLVTLGTSGSRVGRGTRREHEEPVLHPNAIKRLGTGELVLFSHVPEPTVTRVRVSAPPFTSRAPARGARRLTPARRGGRGVDDDRGPGDSRGGDQAAPGMTR